MSVLFLSLSAEIACTTPGFSTLCDLVTLAGLAEPLTNDLLTVFAPTDAAFAELPEELVASLVADIGLLSYVLWYHAVPNADVLTTDLICEGGSLDKLKMANGEDTTISCADGSTFIMGTGNTEPGPQIVTENIVACNGIVQVINGVLIPGPGVTEQPSYSPLDDPTVAPIAPTVAPVTTDPTAAPVSPTPAPVAPTAAPVTTAAPVDPVSPTDAPVDPTPVPVVPTDAPVTPTATPVDPTAAPIDPTAAPIDPTAAPVAPTPAPTRAPTPQPTPAPTPAPVTPTPAPIAGPPTVVQAIQPVALQGGNEFNDPNSYQSRALARTEEQVGINDQSPAKIIQYYALYSIFMATNAIPNIITESEGILDVPGWIVSAGWQSTTLDPCSGAWFGVGCENDLVTELDLFSNLLTGAFPPEVTLLASDGARATGAGALQRIDLFDNILLTNNGDNSWWSQLGSAFGKILFLILSCSM